MQITEQTRRELNRNSTSQNKTNKILNNSLAKDVRLEIVTKNYLNKIIKINSLVTRAHGIGYWVPLHMERERERIP